MPLDPTYKAMLDQMAAAAGPSLIEMPPPEARAMYRAMQPAIEDASVHKQNRTIPGGPGGDIPIRIYKPANSTGPLPVVMNFHGGGWVIGDCDTADAQCIDMCTRAAAAVVSVDYRLAPEHRFPAAADDCYAATLWAHQNASAFGGDGARMAVAGDSAGGNLAAVVAQMARDKKGPKLRFQLLAYPVTDARFDTGSYRDNAEGYLLTKDAMVWFWNHYAPDEAERNNPYASPIRAKSFTGLPPALVLTAEFDPLRDEGEAYADKLREAGIAVDCQRCSGLIHGFFAQSRLVPAALPPMERACAALRAALQ